MRQRLLAISAGAPGGSVEILLKAALQTTQLHTQVRTEITQRASPYHGYHPILRPDGR